MTGVDALVLVELAVDRATFEAWVGKDELGLDEAPQ
jgi:hypothetical protein